MKIGILAYGSLIDDPGPEIANATTKTTRDVLTPFPIEFARSSETRRGAPTLVPVEHGGARVSAVVYGVGTNERFALDILYRREIHKVGSERTYIEPAPGRSNVVRVERFSNFAGYDLVLSTRIERNIDPLTPVHLAKLAIASARSPFDGKDGISYLMAAKKNGIVTALSNSYENEILAQLGAHHLTEALETMRSRR
jgi:hypothetical protein